MVLLRFLIIIFLCLASSNFSPAYAKENAPSSQAYVGLAKKAIENHDYANAEKYFLLAKEIDSNNAAFYDLYLDLVGKLKKNDSKSEDVIVKESSIYQTSTPSEESPPPQRQVYPRTTKYAGPLVQPLIQEAPPVKTDTVLLPQVGIKNVEKVPEKIKVSEPKKIAIEDRSYNPLRIFKYLDRVLLRHDPIKYKTPEGIRTLAEAEEDRLDNQELIWEEIRESALSPVEIPLKMNVGTILKSKTPIKRFLSVNPEKLKVERIDENSLRLTISSFGPFLLHVWDENGRSTISIKGFSKSQIYHKKYEELQKESPIQYVDPFTIKYGVRGSATFNGDELSNMEKESTIRHLHNLEAAGGSPYGMIDMNTLFEQRGGATWTMPYFSLGLTDGHIGLWRNFSLRLFDSKANLSKYTISSKGIRGINYEQRFADERFSFMYFLGKERSGDVALDITQGRDVFINGMKLKYNDSKSGGGRYALNFANIFGSDKLDTEADAVMAVTFWRPLKYDWAVSGEVGFDFSHLAKDVTLERRMERRSYGANISHVDKGYKVLSGVASGEGQLSTGAFFAEDYETWSWGVQAGANQDKGTTASDVVEEQDDWNYNTSATLTNRFSDGSVLRSSAGYDNQNSSLTNRVDMDADTNYAWRFKIGERTIGHNVGLKYQQVKSEGQNLQEFDRYSFNTGVNVPIWKSLGWAANYSRSWKQDQVTDENTGSSRWGTSLGYYVRFDKETSSNIRLGYRDEIESESSSGEQDRLDLTWGLNYRPTPDLELFTTLGVSKTLTNATDAPYQASATWGMKTGWETVFGWNPKGIIEGIIFKDENNNKILDHGEKGLPNIIVFVGDQKLETDAEGRYATYIRGKSARVFVQKDRLPRGYEFTTDFLRTVDVVQHGIQTANFGLMANTSVFGIVFVDKNNNGIFDRDEEGLGGIKISLDGKTHYYSNGNGEFQFFGAEPGEHMIRIDVNSLPPKYLPKIKVQQKIVLVEGQTTVYNVPVVPQE